MIQGPHFPTVVNHPLFRVQTTSKSQILKLSLPNLMWVNGVDENGAVGNVVAVGVPLVKGAVDVGSLVGFDDIMVVVVVVVSELLGKIVGLVVVIAGFTVVVAGVLVVTVVMGVVEGMVVGWMVEVRSMVVLIAIVVVAGGVVVKVAGVD